MAKASGGQVARLHAVATHRARVSVEAKGDLEKPISLNGEISFMKADFGRIKGKSKSKKKAGRLLNTMNKSKLSNDLEKKKGKCKKAAS